MYPSGKRPGSVVALCALEALFGILGVVSGAMLIADPSGAIMGFSDEIRESIPFQSFLPVGLFLLFIFGLGSLLLGYGAWTRRELFLGWLSHAAKRHWSWTGGMLMMVVLVAWLAVEGALIGLEWAATYMTVAIGVSIFMMLVIPTTVVYYRFVSGT
jgi:hypothetical protein